MTSRYLVQTTVCTAESRHNMTAQASSRAAEPSRVRTLCAATLLAFSLAGCASTPDDASPAPSTPAQSAHSPESTEFIPASSEGPAQNVPEPRLPALVTENSEEGARATLEYFWDALNYARHTGDSGPLSLVSTDDCTFCNEHIEGWPQRYSIGDWVIIDGYVELEVSELTTHTDPHSGDWVEISFTVLEPRAILYVDGSAVPSESVDEIISSSWIADLSFDGTAQKWRVEWLGIEDTQDPIQ